MTKTLRARFSRLSTTLCLAAVFSVSSLLPNSAFAADQNLYYRDVATTLFSSSVTVLTSALFISNHIVTAKTQVINASTGTRDVVCTLSFGGSSDQSRVALPSGTKATISMIVLGNGGNGNGQNAVLNCSVLSSSTSGVTTEWSKMLVEPAGTTAFQRQ
jgi:hypothetical protein